MNICVAFLNKWILDPAFAAVSHSVKALLLFMTVLVSGQVFLRATTGRSIFWAEEVSLIAMVWLTFLALAMGIRYDIHIRLDMFVNWLPKRGKIILEYILNLILLFVTGMMVYYGGSLTFHIGMLSQLPATRFPTAVIYGIAPAVGILCCLQILSRLMGGPRSQLTQNFIDGIEYQEDTAKENNQDGEYKSP
ncbi:MAG: TRAP transporter small permease [Planctomycetes bacterium]|nr:TRAP transporter small permease [Planctomycetota bacterium]